MSSTFVRHFITAGVDPNFGLELEENQSGNHATPGGRADSFDGGPHATSSSAFNPLERAYRPRILRKFPDHHADGGGGGGGGGNLASLNDDILCRLILPQGLRFCTQKELSLIHI